MSFLLLEKLFDASLLFLFLLDSKHQLFALHELVDVIVDEFIEFVTNLLFLTFGFKMVHLAVKFCLTVEEPLVISLDLPLWNEADVKIHVILLIFIHCLFLIGHEHMVLLNAVINTDVFGPLQSQRVRGVVVVQLIILTN